MRRPRSQPGPGRSRPDSARSSRSSPRPSSRGGAGKGGEKAADFVIERFRNSGSIRLFGGDYTQVIPGQEPGSRIGRNVGAGLRGADAALRDEWIIVAAHFDHLGIRGGKLYPGADDNASGVAMMLEVARCVTKAPRPPKRSIMFIGFDLEEAGLYGSRYFVAHSPIPLERIALFVTADMIGRSLAGVCGDHVFVIGTEHAPGSGRGSRRPGGGRPLSVDLIGADIMVLNRSDYGPFRNRSIPFLFFTTGENPRYHTPQDTPETLDHRKMTEIAGMIYQVIRAAVDAPAVPRWQDQPDNPIAEAIAIRDVLRILSAHGEELKLGVAQSYVIRSAARAAGGDRRPRDDHARRAGPRHPGGADHPLYRALTHRGDDQRGMTSTGPGGAGGTAGRGRRVLLECRCWNWSRRRGIISCWASGTFGPKGIISPGPGSRWSWRSKPGGPKGLSKRASSRSIGCGSEAIVDGGRGWPTRLARYRAHSRPVPDSGTSVRPIGVSSRRYVAPPTASTR